MTICSCVPWDYPKPYVANVTDNVMICDYYGNSCFNGYIENYSENGLAEECHKECYQGCNEIHYSTATEKEAIDWNKICAKVTHQDYDGNLDTFELETASYIRNLTTHAEDTKVFRFQEALLESDDMNSLRLEYCKQKLTFDIAMVEVIMDSPTFIKYIQTIKATTADKLANFGRFLTYFILTIIIKLVNHILLISIYLIFIGGNLGLFTGMSILSMCEIVFWIIRIILRRTRRT